MAARWHWKVSSCTQPSQNTREKERESRLKKPRERDAISFHALQADEDHSTFSMGPIKADHNRNKDDRIFVLFVCTYSLNIIFLRDALSYYFYSISSSPLFVSWFNSPGRRALIYFSRPPTLFKDTRRLTCIWWWDIEEPTDQPGIKARENAASSVVALNFEMLIYFPNIKSLDFILNEGQHVIFIVDAKVYYFLIGMDDVGRITDFVAVE